MCLLLLLLVLLLLGSWWWADELRRLHVITGPSTASASAEDTATRLRSGSLVLACRGRRRHLVRHEPWTVSGGCGGRICGRYDRRREPSVVAHHCRLPSARMLQVDRRRVAVHSVQRHAASGRVAA